MQGKSGSLESVPTTILQRHRDEHLGKKTLIMQGFVEMSQRYPERDYRASIDRALAELTGAVHLHLNAELHGVTTLVVRLGKTTAGQTGVTHIEPQATQESARSSASVWRQVRVDTTTAQASEVLPQINTVTTNVSVSPDAC